MTLLIPESIDKDPAELHRHYAERIIEYNIVTLNLPPGMIVSANELACELGISKTPVHEALNELSRRHLTQVIPQVGTRIALIDIKHVEAICFLRYCVEREMFHHLPKRFPSRTIADLRSITKRCEQAYKEKNFLKFLQLDNSFHTRLFFAANLQEAGMILEDALPNFNRVRMLIYRNLNVDRIIAEHIGIINSLERGDRKQAQAILTKHLKHDVVRDLNTLKEKFPELFYFSDSNHCY